jgi:hypothetical protein
VKWTRKRINDLRDEVHQNPRLAPKMKRGFKGNPLFLCFSPDQYVPPLLYLQMELVNKVWLVFLEWLDEEAELVPTIEKEIRDQQHAAKDEAIKLDDELGDLRENYIIINNQLLADKKVQQDMISFSNSQEEIAIALTMPYALCYCNSKK